MDDWLALSAARLGVSQRVMETEYYLVDIPTLLRYKTQMVAEERLMALQIATVSQAGDKDVYSRFVDQLRGDLTTSTDAGETKKSEFDRSGLEQLRGRVGRR